MKIRIFVALTTNLVVVSIVIFSAGAQGLSNEWSEPEVVFSPGKGQKTNELWVLSDQAAKLYLWWPIFSALEDESTDGSKPSTFHTQRIEEHWRNPIDVMVWPDAGRLTSVIIDQTGGLHAFSATDCVSYMTSHQDEALSAISWGNRTCLDDAGLTNPSVAQSSEGTIFVVYAVQGNHAIRMINSKDERTTWSAYTTLIENPDDFLVSPMLAIDENDRLHLVWSVGEAPDSYPPIGVFYSRSDDGGISWTSPVQLGGEDEGQPAVAVKGEEVHVLWNGDAAKRGRYYRYSPDAGESWSSVEVLSSPSSQGGNGGLQRPPAIVVDNVGNVHALLHEQESLYYVTKTDFGWTAKQALYNPEFMKGVELFGVRLAITGGNTLHALYILESYDRSKTEDRRNHIWRVFHQSTEIKGISETPVSWPTPVPEDTRSATVTQDDLEVLKTNTLQPPQNIKYNDDLVSANSYNPAWSIYVGVTSVSVFIFFLLILFFVKQRR